MPWPPPPVRSARGHSRPTGTGSGLPPLFLADFGSESNREPGGDSGEAALAGTCMGGRVACKWLSLGML